MHSAPETILDNKKFPHDSAGAIATNKVPTTYPAQTVKELKTYITENADEFESLNYIYVVNHNGELVGILSIKDIYRHSEHEIVGDFMQKEFVSTHPYTLQERAAYIALNNNIKALPIIDREHKFLGVITSDKILSIMHRELNEDFMRFVGFRHSVHITDDDVHMSVWNSIKHRLPWIFIGLIGGLLIAETIGAFENTLEQNVLIASFIPLMVYISNAVGQQITAFIIRDYALNTEISLKKYLIKQVAIVVIIATVLALVLFVYGIVIQRQLNIANVLALAMFSTTVSSIFTGFFIPFMFIKAKLDPANASGPIGTMLQDFISVLIYFVICSALL